jgi:hypothetical protein
MASETPMRQQMDPETQRNQQMDTEITYGQRQVLAMMYVWGALNMKEMTPYQLELLYYSFQCGIDLEHMLQLQRP